MVAASRNAPALALWEAMRSAGAEGSYLELLQARIAYMRVQYGHWTTLLPNSNFTLFIVGLLAVRHGVVDEPRRHVRLILGWMAFGVTSFAIAWLVLRHVPELPVARATWTVRYGLGLIQDQWLTFTYAGALALLLAYWPVWARRLSPFGLAGRMALTNYILQAAVLDYLTSGYGESLRLRPIAILIATAMLFAVEVAISRLWLRRYRFGPLEWVWRCMTYGRWQPLRKETAPAATSTA